MGDETSETKLPCNEFSWVGESSWKRCGDCGLAYWNHTHEKRGERVPIPKDWAERVRNAKEALDE